MQRPSQGPGADPGTSVPLGPELAARALAARRPGLFGGSFDPVHRGHLTVVRAALTAAGIDHLVVVPARISPHKLGRGPAPGPERAAMLAAALGTLPESLRERTSIWTTELERPGPSYTIDTVREFERRRPSGGERLRLVLGQDSLAGLPRWHEREALLAAVDLAIVPRGAGPPLEAELARLAGALSDDVLRRIEAGWIDLAEPSDASSTAVRDELHSGVEHHEHLPEPVSDRIRRGRLYGSGGTRPEGGG